MNNLNYFGKRRYNLDSFSVLARAFEYNVAKIFVVSIACGSDSHCVT